MRKLVASLVVLAAALFAVACSSDPYLAALAERQRWEVRPASWTFTDQPGRIRLVVQIEGPPSTSIETFTFRVDMYDASDDIVDSYWHAVDVADIPRGAPEKLSVSFSTEVYEQVEDLAVQSVPVPTNEERPHIVELQGLAPRD